MWRQAFRLLVVAGSGVCLMGAACQPAVQTVKVGTGSQVKNVQVKAGEYQLIQQARAAKKSQDANAERKAWEELLARFAGTEFRSEAELRLGILDHKAGKHQMAVQRLSQVLSKSALVPKERSQGLLAYGGALMKLGRHGDALKALSHAYDSLDASQKKQILPAMIESARKTNDLQADIRWSAEQMPYLDQAGQARTRARLLGLVDGRLSLQALRVLFERGGDSVSFPFDYIGYRLARAYCHSQQRAACQSTLKVLIAKMQPTHTLYTDLQRMLQRSSALAKSVNPLKIGVIYPQSGRGKIIGKWVWSAIQLAMRNYPDQPIRLVPMDSKSMPEYAVKAVETLVRKHNVSAIMGPILSRGAVAAAYKAQQLGVPIMTISVRETLPLIGSYIFRNNLTRSQMGRALANFSFKRLGHTRYAVFYPNSPFGRIQVEAFWKEIERLGGKIVSAEPYAPTTVNFSDMAKLLVGRYHLSYRPEWHKRWRQVRVKSYLQRRRLYKQLKKELPPVLDFDAIFVPETFGQLRKIVSALVQQDMEFKRHYPFWEKQTSERYKKRNVPLKFIQLLGSNTWYDHRILGLPQVDLQQYVGSLFCVRYFARSKRQVVRKFVRDFTSSYSGMFPMLRNQPPIHIAAYSFDSMQMLLHIATTKKPKTRQAFRDALLGLRGFPGVTGPLSVASDGNVLGPIRFLLIHRQGEFRLFHELKQLDQ